MFRLFSILCFRVFRWKIVGKFPESIPKYVVIAAPHTSNWDFVIAVMARSITGMRAVYLGKAELFRPPFGWLFRALGGYPVQRSEHHDMVSAIVNLFKEKERFSIGIAPEGTRKKVEKWRTGFYYIAKGANVPIIMVALDYEHRELRIAEPFYPTDNFEADWQFIQAYFKDVKGKHVR